MKIAVITSTFKPELSGVAEAVYTRCMHLANSGHEILILAPDYSEIAHLFTDHTKYVGKIHPQISVKPYPSKSLKEKKDARCMISRFKYTVDKDLESFEPDIIHVDEPYRIFGLRIFDGHMSRPGVSFARRHGIPITAMWHTDFVKYAEYYHSRFVRPIIVPPLTKLFSWVYNAYDRVFCHSQYGHDTLKNMGVNPAKLYVGTFHGINIDLFKPPDGISETDSFTILYVGRVEVEKNLDILFDAYLKLKKENQKINLHIIGDGAQLPELKEKYGKGSDIVFYGRMTQSELPYHYSRAHVFVNPSVTETFGNTVVEAALCNTPVIAARAGGHVDTVNDTFNGLLFDPSDPLDLYNKLRSVLENSSLHQRLRENSRKFGLEYDPSKVAHNFTVHFKELQSGIVSG
ncbi:MAG: glycosyltransferase [Candidatus Odinarchaeota archaeon]